MSCHKVTWDFPAPTQTNPTTPFRSNDVPTRWSKQPKPFFHFQEIDRKQNTEVANTGEFPPEYLIKHPLQNTWTLWYYEPDKNKSWEESQREITSFDTAEDFWRYIFFFLTRERYDSIYMFIVRHKFTIKKNFQLV